MRIAKVGVIWTAAPPKRGKGDEKIFADLLRGNFFVSRKIIKLSGFLGFSAKNFVVSCEWPRSAFGFCEVNSISQSAE